MKKTILTLACTAFALASNAQTISAKISDLKNDTVQIMIVNSEMTSVEKTETVIAKKGKFTYNYTGDKAAMAMMTMKGAEGPARIQFFLVPGEMGTLTGTSQSAKWGGSNFYAELGKLEAITDPIQNKMSDISSEFTKKVQEGANRDSLQSAILPEYNALADQLMNANANYIKENPGSNVSASLLPKIENAEEAMALLTPEVKNGVFSNVITAIQARIDKENARKEAAKAVAAGCAAPDFTLKDLNGNDLALSSLRGKYLILDFWGSWCGWCIKGFPEMKKYYAKYSDKLEILGVDCNDTEDKWKAAVEKNELPWKHVYCPRTSDVPTMYAIEGFPTKIVIDPQGNIVKTIIGEDPAFYTYLDELFK